MAQVHLGLFSDRYHADQAVDDLTRAGYDPAEMSIIAGDTVVNEQAVEQTSAPVVEGTASGATTGGVIGGIAGLLVGLGAISLPGIGALFVGGPIAAVLGLTGAAATTVSGVVTGALAGGLVGALVSLGVPRETAEIYESGIKAGGVLLAVPTRDDREQESRDILESHGADQIRSVTLA